MTRSQHASRAVTRYPAVSSAHDAVPASPPHAAGAHYPNGDVAIRPDSFTSYPRAVDHQKLEKFCTRPSCRRQDGEHGHCYRLRDARIRRGLCENNSMDRFGDAVVMWARQPGRPTPSPSESPLHPSRVRRATTPSGGSGCDDEFGAAGTRQSSTAPRSKSPRRPRRSRRLFETGPRPPPGSGPTSSSAVSWPVRTLAVVVTTTWDAAGTRQSSTAPRSRARGARAEPAVVRDGAAATTGCLDRRVLCWFLGRCRTVAVVVTTTLDAAGTRPIVDGATSRRARGARAEPAVVETGPRPHRVRTDEILCWLGWCRAEGRR